MLGPSTSPLGIPRSVIENALSFNGSNVNFNGKVGIGTTSPTAKLHSYNTTLNTPAGFFENTRNGGGDYGVRILNSNTGGSATVLRIDGLGTGNLFEAFDNSISVFVVKDGGNVGIGTTSPAAKLDILDATLAGSGSLSGSALNIAQTWNTTGTPTAIKLDVTDTASNASSLLMDLQVGGVSKVKVGKDGVLRTRYLNGLTDGGYISTSNAKIYGNNIGFGYHPNEVMGSIIAVGNTVDNPEVYIRGEGSNTLAQRNGANAQTFRIYNTYTDASNYERGFMRWNSNVLEIGAEGAGTGQNRNLEFVTGGSTRMTITSGGEIISNRIVNITTSGNYDTALASYSSTGSYGSFTIGANSNNYRGFYIRYGGGSNYGSTNYETKLYR